MNATIDRLAPTPLARLHALADLFLVSALSWTLSHTALPWGRLAAVTAVTGVAWLAAAAAIRAYQVAARPRRGDQAGVWAFQTVVATTVAFLTAEALGVPGPAARELIWTAGGLALTRIILVKAQLMAGRPNQQVLVVGVGPLARTLAAHLERGRNGKSVVGFIPLEGEVPLEALALRQAGPVGSLATVLSQHTVDEVYVAGSAVTQSQSMQQAVGVCEELGMPFALPVHALALERAQPLGLDRRDLGFIHHIESDERAVPRTFKRLFDVAASSFALLVLSPVLLLVALAIKVTSRGPVFFKQPRAGMHGRPFNMLKFRSMVLDADAMQAQLATLNEQKGPVFKIKNDPRVTRVGRFIRRYSIDELPQLVNILRGEMSVVGPRPPVPKEVARYLPWQRRRLSVRPGLTCHWQVSGRNNIPFEEWMLLDLRYIDQWSFFTDLKLIAKTIPAVLTGHGAS